MAGYGVSYSLLGSAQSALLPALVPADLLGAANSALQTLIRATPALRRPVAAALVIGASVFGFLETVQFAVVSSGLHRSPPFPGVLEVAQGGGAVLAGLLAARLMARAGERVLVAGGLLACAAGCALEASPLLALVIAGAALVGGCIVWINIGAITLIQHQTPGHLLGRVDGAVHALVTVPQAASIAAGAAAPAVAGYRVLLAVMTAVLLAAAAYLARGRRVRPAPPAVDTGGNQQSSAGVDTMQPGVR